MNKMPETMSGAIVSVLPYGLFAFSVVMGGMAAASLVKSPEERTGRESFLYINGAFMAYATIAFIGVLVLLYMYKSGLIIGFLARTAVAGGLIDLGSGYEVSYLGTQFGVPPALDYARKTGYLPPSLQNPQPKVRRHGRYNT